MKAEVALDMPLNDAELDELEAFLMSDQVSEDCMGLEMLDGFLTACVSAPNSMTPSQWLPVIWGTPPDPSRVGSGIQDVAFSSAQQAQRILELILRHWSSLSNLLREMPTLYKPLLYTPENNEDGNPPEGVPYEAHEWCLGYMTGVLLDQEQWQPLNEDAEASDWLFPIEALAFGDQEPEYAEWIDDAERRDTLVDELPIAVVLIYRFWNNREDSLSTPRSKRRVSKTAAKRTARLH
jgi:uncharacterized protein